MAAAGRDGTGGLAVSAVSGRVVEFLGEIRTRVAARRSVGAINSGPATRGEGPGGGGPHLTAAAGSAATRRRDGSPSSTQAT